MNKLRLIIAREYMSIVGRKSFILMTLGMPLLFIIIGAVPMLLGYLNDKGSPTQLISVVDETGRYGAALHSDEMYTYLLGASTATGQGDDAGAVISNVDDVAPFVGVGCIGSGIAVGHAAPAAIGALAEEPKSFAKAL